MESEETKKPHQMKNDETKLKKYSDAVKVKKLIYLLAMASDRDPLSVKEEMLDNMKKKNQYSQNKPTEDKQTTGEG